MNPGPVPSGERGRLLSPLLSTLNRLSPRRLVAAALADLPPERRPTAFVALGKAAVPMAEGAFDAGVAPSRALVVPPAGTAIPERFPFPVLPGDHPIPGDASFAAGRAILDLVDPLDPSDRLLLLLSGGGSALAEARLGEEGDAASLPLIVRFTREALRVAMPIAAINAVRKRLSAIKGGRLAARCRARIGCLIVSDVPSGRPELVASGPVFPDPSACGDALRSLEGYGLAARLPELTAFLRAAPETPKADDPCFSRTTTRVLLDRAGFLHKLAETCKESFAAVVAVDPDYDLPVEALAERIVSLRVDARRETLFLLCGEATVTLRGNGRGGRNQELAARMLPRLLPGESLLSFATDGVDGNCPEPVAGAFADDAARAALAASGLDPQAFLARSDSYGLLSPLGALVATGATGHNLGDVVMFKTGGAAPA